jgi:hypothetical protein
MLQPLLLQGFCLINQHDRDIVSNLIEEFAAVTDKTVLRIVQINISLAFWAGKDIQQILTDRHRILLLGWLRRFQD